MPVGKVLFYDTDKGFGFIEGENKQRVYVPGAVAKAADLVAGDRVDYAVGDGARGPYALSVSVLQSASRQRKNKKSPDQMAVIVEDLMKLLDAVGERFQAGNYPERAQSRKLAQMLRHLAAEFDA